MFKELGKRKISLLESGLDDGDAVRALADVVVRKVWILNAQRPQASAHRQLASKLLMTKNVLTNGWQGFSQGAL